MSQITLYTRLNVEIIKAPVLIEEVSWFENEPGRLLFTLSLDHPMARREYLKWGTRVVADIEGFPLWVGFVEPPRKWGNSTVIVNCKSMEYFFKYRRARFATLAGLINDPLTVVGTSGALVEHILDIANRKVNTGIELGNIFSGGPNRQETLNETLDIHLTNIAGRSGCTWNVEASVSGPELVLKLNMVPKTTINVDYLVEEGVNLETPDSTEFLVEDGNVYNDILGVGELDENLQTIAYELTEPSYVDDYDLRQAIVTFMGNTRLPTLQSNVQDELKMRLEAGIVLNPVVPYTPESATKLAIGSTIPVLLHSAGFRRDGTIGADLMTRIIGVTYMGRTEMLSLIVGNN